MKFNIEDFGVIDTEGYQVECCPLDDYIDDTYIKITDKAVLDRLTTYIHKFYNVVEAIIYTRSISNKRYISIRIDKRCDVGNGHIAEIIDDMLYLDVLDSGEQG